MKKLISWLLVIFWMILIFTFSHQPRENSNKLSTGITQVIVEAVKKVVPNENINIRSFNHILRKNAHFFIYLILGISVTNAFKNSGVIGNRLIINTLVICILYAISDEIHQLFVPGRGGQVKDVIIDSAGSTVGLVLYLLIIRFYMKNRQYARN